MPSKPGSRPNHSPSTRPRPGITSGTRSSIFRPRLLCTDRRHGRYDLLLATNDFDNEALAIEVALLIETDIQQHAWIVLGRDFRPMQRCGQRLAIEFADLL